MTPFDVRCAFCGAEQRQPCRTVGNLPKIAPHMQRIRLAGDVSDGDAGRDAYARSVMRWFFRDYTDDMLARARKDGSIDATAPWVRRALAEA